MDDPQDAARAAAGPAPACSLGRRPLRHLGPERSLPPGHQPQQSPAAPARPLGAGHHRAQRKAHAAGIGRCAARQRPPGPGHHRYQQAGAEVARGHDQGQAGPLSAEPARQAGRLLRAFGHRRRADAEAASVRPAQEDGLGTVQAVHLRSAPGPGARHHHQGRQEGCRAGDR